MHKLLEWIRQRQGDAPPESVDAKDIVDELPDEIEDGYTPIEGSDGSEP